MSAYNAINGVFASENRWLLTELLRDEWGFDGLVVSDWGAIKDRVDALAAGLDLEMPGSDGQAPREIVDAVHAASWTRPPSTAAPAGRSPSSALRDTATGDVDAEAHHALARERPRAASCCCATTAARCRCRGRRVAVLGEFAVAPAVPGRRQLARQRHPRRHALDELRARRGHGVYRALGARLHASTPTQRRGRRAARRGGWRRRERRRRRRVRRPDRDGTSPKASTASIDLPDRRSR